MSYLKIKKPEVVHETMDGEVVVVNLDKGLYFSIDGVGAAIWSMLDAATSVGDIATWGSNHYPDVATVGADISAFLERIRELELVADSAEPPSAGTTEPLAAPSPYRPPMINVYSDMEELLLLDPIHEVDDDAGWPSAAES